MIQPPENQGICEAPFGRMPVACPGDCQNRQYCDITAQEQGLSDLRTLFSNIRSKDNQLRLRSKLQFARFKRRVVDRVGQETGLTGHQAELEAMRRCNKQNIP